MSSLRVKNVMATFALVAAFSFSLPASPAWASPLASSVNEYIITTIAGNGISGSSGDGGPATQAELTGPGKIALGPDGSLYIADTYGQRIRHVGLDGIITTVAGTGSIGFSGDGGPATQAELNYPDGVAVGPDGTFYISDHNQRVRAVGPDGIITTIAGNGIEGYGGDGGPALDAQFDFPDALAVGPDGSIYVSDHFNSRIRRIGPDGIITTVAGNGTQGFSGDGGPATDAQLIVPGDIAVAPDGSLYIPDYGNQRIRHVDINGIITTVAGNGNAGYSGDGGPATQAEFFNPSSIAIGADGSLFIGDESRHLRQVAPDGIITTIAGNGTTDFGGDGIPATQAGFVVAGVITGPNGTLYLSDGLNVRIRLLTPANQVPDCTNAQPSVASLWPPNHKFVQVAIQGVTDADGDVVTITIDSIFQDEPVNGTGDGDTAPDAQGIGTSLASLRSERAGNGNGRIYHLSFTASDPSGATCTGNLLVSVPHDKNKAATDGGAHYDSTAANAEANMLSSAQDESTPLFLPLLSR